MHATCQASALMSRAGVVVMLFTIEASPGGIDQIMWVIRPSKLTGVAASSSARRDRSRTRSATLAVSGMTFAEVTSLEPWRASESHDRRVRPIPPDSSSFGSHCLRSAGFLAFGRTSGPLRGSNQTGRCALL